jgi:hypothetical protein
LKERKQYKNIQEEGKGHDLSAECFQKTAVAGLHSNVHISHTPRQFVYLKDT